MVDPAVGTGAGDRPVVLRIDPRTSEIVGDSIALERFHPFAFGEGGVWFVGEMEPDRAVDSPRGVDVDRR